MARLKGAEKEMKTFKVREKFVMKGWTYVKAETEEEAIKKIEEGQGSFEEEYDEWADTDWKTFQETT